jgi:hypothetical protein
MFYFGVRWREGCLAYSWSGVNVERMKNDSKKRVSREV